MAEVLYTDIPDTQAQQIKQKVANVREMNTPTYDSFEKSNRKIKIGQQGYQIPFFVTDYGQNSYLAPGATSFSQPVAPTSKSMYVGLAYPGKALFTDGILLDTMDTKASLINEAQLRNLAIENYMKHMNYYAIGDNAGYGILAVTSSNTGGTFTGTTAAATTSGQTKGAHRLIKGVTYDVVDESSLAVVGTMTPTVNGTNSATVTCTTTGSVNNAGSYVVEQGAFYKVPRGLNYLINSTNRIFQDLDTTNYVEFNSSVVDLNGSALTASTINTLKTRVQIRTNAERQDTNRVGHLTQGLYNVLAIQGFGARQYQAADGQNTTSYGYPYKYVDGDILWVADADMDEDRVFLRRRSDYACVELTPFGQLNRDGLTKRQSVGSNNVGADSWYENWRHYFNFMFDAGDNVKSEGNYASAFIMRAQVTAGTSQVTTISG